ncbi:CRISPR-associated endoribonuclease Cas6 [Priestia megaterium]|nr:CRISPR-associated endoribonuclease Cas6 [Priestia megaterium]
MLKELKINVVLTHPMHFHDAGEELGEFLHFIMTEDEELKIRHEERVIKLYNFSHLFPIEKTGVYEPGKAYFFRVRSARQNFLDKIAFHIKRVKWKGFIVLSTEWVDIRTSHNQYFRTLTPFVIIHHHDKGKYWTEEAGNLARHITNNLLHKYRVLVGLTEKIDKEVIQDVKLLSTKPAVLNYKGNKMLGHKLLVSFRDDLFSQQIKDLAITAGVGEKNSSLGAGFLEPCREVRYR